MTNQPAPDLEAKLVELEYEIGLAIQQGVINQRFLWRRVLPGRQEIAGPDTKERWVAVLTVRKL
jgi:hypothetical protein